jgi:NRAMP (natural resistance-associated macrophage protein)-like metal ion transporter
VSKARTASRGKRESDWPEYFKAIGPGLITGASDDDPSGVATYSQAGAQFQYGLLWTSLVTLPLMAAVQEICDRTALATGKPLGALADERFRRWRKALSVLIGLLIVANLLNIAADTSAVGEGMNLLHAGPAGIWAALAGTAVTVLIIVGSFERITIAFKVLSLALLTYVVVLFAAHPKWTDVLTHTLIPHVQFSKGYMLLFVAVLGTTISPYLFFWQSANRIEDLRADDEGGSKAQPLDQRRRPKLKLRTSRLDDFTGMGFSNLVMFAIIVSTGATIGANGNTTITSASQAAQALKPAAGGMAQTLFALGFIGSGMLAIPVLAGSGASALASLLHKPWGFSHSFRNAPFFYVLVGIGTLGGTLFTLLGVDPVKLLVFSALINGLLAPPFLILVMLISNDREIMGEHRNGRAAHVLGWTATGLMTIAALLYLALNYL